MTTRSDDPRPTGPAAATGRSAGETSGRSASGVGRAARVMALVGATTFAVLTGLVGGAPPTAASDVECSNSAVANGCGGGQPAPSRPGATGGQGSGPASPVYYYRTFVRDGQGVDEGDTPYDGCWTIATTTDPSRGGTYEEAMRDLVAMSENGVSWGACDGPADDPEEVAAIYWERASSPPPPTPLAIAPGYALTGLTAYLVIGGDVPHVETHATPLGTLTFRMTPRYVVSWGDGTTTETSSQGVPHPGGPGEISHVYTQVGTVTVSVSAHWSTSWDVGGASGDLPELVTPTEATLSLPVEQRQVVTD